MDIEYKGGNCVVISTKNNTIAIDSKISDLGLRDQGTNATLQLATQTQFIAPHGDRTIVIQGPGEYEVSNISIRGIAARAHTDGPGEPKRATMFVLSADDVTIAVTGHAYPELSEEQLEALGVVDVLIVPVGGNGYTLDAAGAVGIIRQVSPKIVIPTHYADNNANYPVPQAELDVFLKELAATMEVSSKLKLKSGSLGEGLTVQQLSRVA